MNISTGIESATKSFLEKVNSNTGPAIYELPVEEGRQLFNNLQTSANVSSPAADIEEITVPTSEYGDVKVRIVRPPNSKKTLPVLMYIHGAGWVFGGWETHQRLVLELVDKAQCAVAFVEFSLSPEAQYPVAIEQSYAVLKHIADNAKKLNVDPSRLAVGGDSVGGNMTIAVTMLAKQRGGPRIDFQLLFYPVTDAGFDTGSYKQVSRKTLPHSRGDEVVLESIRAGCEQTQATDGFTIASFDRRRERPATSPGDHRGVRCTA